MRKSLHNTHLSLIFALSNNNRTKVIKNEQ